MLRSAAHLLVGLLACAVAVVLVALWRVTEQLTPAPQRGTADPNTVDADAEGACC